MSDNKPAPWVAVDADEGTFSLYGNEEGFRVLREAIDSLLACNSEEIPLDLRPGGIEGISLSDDHPDDDRGPQRFRDKLILWLVSAGVLGILAFILLLSFLGFYQLIKFF